MGKLKLTDFVERPCYCYDYQPGNGTRYEIVYCPGPETFLFGWYNVPGGKIAEFSSTAGLLVPEYFMKKLGITSPADTAALLTLVHELTGRPIELPVGYDARGEAL